jgi:hypothetical protein
MSSEPLTPTAEATQPIAVAVADTAEKGLLIAVLLLVLLGAVGMLFMY